MTGDGNVIHPPCWHPQPPESAEPAPVFNFSFDMLYQDEFFMLGRLTYRMGDDVHVLHVTHDAAE